MELIHPCTMIIAGPSGSGKTVFVKKILKSTLFDVKFNQVIWCYSEMGSLNDRSPDITYVEGLPSEDYYDGTPKLVILDDLMHETDDRVAKLFTRISHHRNLSVILINQNIFPRNKNARDIALNASYMVVFKSPRDKSQINHLARQVSPENSKFFIDAYLDATSTPHGYLFVDFKQSTHDSHRISTSIFDEHPIIYTPR